MPLRHTLLDGLVLRSCDRFGLEQELWAQLTVYQVLRRAMVDAVESVPGTDPDRASFTVALDAARHQVISADGVLPHGAYTVGRSVIGHAVLGSLLPTRRARMSVRRVKCVMSRYSPKPGTPDERPPTSTAITHLDISIHQVRPATIRSQEGENRSIAPARPGGNGRRDRTLQLLRGDPDRAWHLHEIAEALDISHYRSLCAQLGHWAKEGMLLKATRGAYALAPAWISPAQQTPQSE